MTIEERILKDCLIFKGIRGSHAYGTNIEGSDEDIVGIYIQPDDDLLGIKYIPQISIDNSNQVYYELRRFYELAMEGNPNILEIFDLPEDCILYENRVFTIIKHSKDKFITKHLFNSFANYARSQIKKAKGFNKKMNWDMNKVTRKDVLDFCYVITRKEESTPFKSWIDNFPINAPFYDGKVYNVGIWHPISIYEKHIGLAKVNNIPNLYSMYSMNEGGGIVSEDSNDVQLRSIPKDAPHLGYLQFDKNAYSTHCKHYREYQAWLTNRNPLRYDMNKEHGKGYDAKNMMHCIRLINTAIDIAQGRGLVIRRPKNEIESLLSIRRGEMEYEDLIELADVKIQIAEESFMKSNLPSNVDENIVHYLINLVRDAYRVPKNKLT